MSKLFIIRGIPGSGKSTTAAHLKSHLIKFGYTENDIVHAEADMYFMDEAGNYNFDASKLGIAHEICFNTIETALKENKVAIVSNTFVDAKSVEKYIKLANKYDAELTIYRRATEFNSIHNVPKAAIDRMRENFADIQGEIILNTNLLQC